MIEKQETRNTKQWRRGHHSDEENKQNNAETFSKLDLGGNVGAVGVDKISNIMRKLSAMGGEPRRAKKRPRRGDAIFRQTRRGA